MLYLSPAFWVHHLPNITQTQREEGSVSKRHAVTPPPKHKHREKV